MLREIRLLQAGQCLIDRSELVRGDPEGEMVRVPIWMYLLRTDDALLLVDSGMPRECVGNERFFAGEEGADRILPQMAADDAVDRVLAAHGHAIGDIDGLIGTHFHFDHAGGQRLFRQQPVLMHPAEIESARQEAELAPWVDLSLDLRPVEDGAEPSAGVMVLHTPGHTPGHLSLLLRPAGERPVVLTVDATYSARNWELNIPGAMLDDELGRQSVARLKEIARDTSAAVFFGHDAEQARAPQWQRLMR